MSRPFSLETPKRSQASQFLLLSLSQVPGLSRSSTKSPKMHRGTSLDVQPSLGFDEIAPRDFDSQVFE